MKGLSMLGFIKKNESGFTLIELLVVIIIIGILASVAVPIYLNQQKTARDSATTSDVKNVATNLQSLLVKYPDATSFAVSALKPPANVASYTGNSVAVTNGGLWVVAGNNLTSEYDTVWVALSEGTRIAIGDTGTPGSFVLKGFNTSGKNYITLAGGLRYANATGGINP
jgi:type IV pilus assembly protein PilA